MALAFLRYEDKVDDKLKFYYDLGSNLYFQLAIGPVEHTLQDGFTLMAAPAKILNLVGPIDASTLGKGRIDVPSQLFDNANHCVQLWSYAGADKAGKAVSSIINLKKEAFLTFEPPVSTANSLMMNHIPNAHSQPMELGTYAESIAFCFKEKKYSEAQFLQGLLSAVGPLIQQIAPQAIGLIGSLLSGGNRTAGTGTGTATTGTGTAAAGTGTATTGAAGGANIAQLLNNPQIAELIRTLLAGLSQAPATTGTAAAASLPTYSEAKVAPLAALLPLLTSLLTPETIRGILDAAPNMVGKVTEGIANLSRIGLEGQRQIFEHLRAIHPDLGPPVDSLLSALSLSPSQSDATSWTAYRRANTVKINFEAIETIELGRFKTVFYAAGTKMSIPFNISAPTTIAKPVATLVVKCAQKRTVLVRRTIKLEPLNPAVSNGQIALSAEDSAKLPLDKELMLTLHLSWETKKKEKVGTNMTMAFRMAQAYLFDYIDSGGTVIPLNDVQAHRAFWHKVYEADLSKGNRVAHIDLRYYYKTEANRGVNARSATKHLESSDDKVKIKAGMLLSPAVLRSIAAQQEKTSPIPQEKLAALHHPDFEAATSLMANFKHELRGWAGERFAIWVWPELRLAKIALQKVAKVNDNGLVLAFEPEFIQFPVPAYTNFVITKS